MAEGEVLSDFCGSTFWDANITWHTENPDFTPCFERTVLVWIPCIFLWLLAPLETHYLIKSVDRLIPWSWLNISKLAVSSVLVLIQFIEIFYAVHLINVGEKVEGYLYLTPIIILLSLVLQMVFIVMEKKRGIQSCGYLFMFWLLLFLCGLPEFRTYLLNVQDETVEFHVMTFGTYMAHYPLVVVMLILNCFGDATPQYVDYPRSEKACPEASASFISRVTFAWVDSLIWKGYRNPLKEDDLWDLTYENASRTVVSNWEKNWQKTKAKAYKKGESHTSATYANSSAHVEISGTSGDKEYLSILPALVKSFGPSFLFGGLLKFAHDVLQFLSPQILSALIKFTESSEEDEPIWHGYLYAVLMFTCAQVQSLCLGQYFMRMFLVGLRMRTAIISAVYTKAMRISNSAKKKSTTGEIVNLMSVDAQRFMDITTYINMLWSAPLQIGLALYFLWDLLGPSVLAGLAVMIIVIPINGVIAKKTKDLQFKQMKNKDHRVKLMNEILNGIKVLKLYAWEESFEEQVLQVRGKEIKVLKQMAYLTAGTSFIWTCTPFLVSLATFATYVNISDENVLDAKTAFVSLSLFNLLRFPIAMLPMLISSLVQASVSLKRMNKFMNVDELDPNSVIHDNQESRPIVVENGTFAWGHEDDDAKPVLKGINLSISDGSLVAVVGNVGAGKSSLCSAILGEMERQSGRVNVKGKIAYVSQQAWIQNATLENNILFNQSKENSKYETCIKSCALRADLEMLPAGDQTEIGEKGINLSGGQKQRISLARAVYSDADIYLLDDPLSAVDSHVGKHIFEHVIGPQGILKRKTRILVTHGLTYLSQVDKIIVLKNGVITEEGTYKELLERKGEFQEFLLQYLTEGAYQEDDISLEDIKQQLESSLGKEVVQKQISRQKRESESDSLTDSTEGRSKSGHHEKKISESESGNSVQASDVKKTDKAGEKLIEAEKAETGKVQLEVYKYYIRAIGLLSAAGTVLFYILSQSCTVGSNIWLSEWSEEASKNVTMESHVRDMYLGVYGAFGVGQVVGAIAADLRGLLCMAKAAKRLHNQLSNSILRQPQYFFDVRPVGRILNRFSSDIDAIDIKLPDNLLDFAWCVLDVLSTFLVIIASTPIFVVVMIPIMIIYFFVQRLYVASSRQLKRIESVSRSPIYSHFQESLQGSSTIRAYGRQNQFIAESEKKVDFNQICNYPSVMTNRWLAVRLEFIGNVMTFFATLFAVMSRGSISGGVVGLSISYALSVTQTLNWLVRMTSDVETNVVAVERIKEYTEMPQEAPWEMPNNKPHKDWPEEGVVEFRNYSTRYRQGLDLVVKNINCKILKGEKIGIVGRTGAGKSSLTLALFRIIEPAGGEIVIDNVDITKIGLHDLRGKLTIIPQDPVLFSGTLRMNLDPFAKYEDSKVWSALEQAHLKEFVSGLTSGLQHEVSEGGENLSVGQRQLVCLARALLRKSRVLVLDEATAAVDLETDDLIQQTIRREFSDCTVITIAHRLNTIMDSTRVLVLAHGEIKEFDSPSTLLADKNSLFYGMAKDAGLV
ncbi:multidrug resistance-associated protein 1-like isoform X2 [Palaemon carinicauda]|uniref:multidrug resistance-associated protein 1-like isoform X2 n=1 Tax=Palaemon carinicauda TaxID=392227 RepID=UPI0035B635B8